MKSLSIGVAELSEATRMAFARTLHLWRLRNGWAHDTLHQWGDAADWDSVRNSTFSKLERGLIVQPALKTFLQLAEANRRLHAQDFGIIAQQRLRETVQAGEAIVDDEDRPWGAIHFFAHFLGAVEPPHWARLDAAYLSDPQAAEALSQEQRNQFLRYAQDQMLSRQEAWQQLQPICIQTGMEPLQIEQFRLVLAGHHLWQPVELRGLIDEIGRNRSQDALLRWIDDGGLTVSLKNRLAS